MRKSLPYLVFPFMLAFLTAGICPEMLRAEDDKNVIYLAFRKTPEEAQAIYEQGLACEFPEEGKPRNLGAVREFYLQAAWEGNLPACVRLVRLADALGEVLRPENSNEDLLVSMRYFPFSNHFEAQTRILQLKEDGNPEAIWICACSRLKTAPFEDEKSQLFRDIQTVVESGLPEGMTSMGYCCERGIGVEANRDEAIRWFEKAREAGDYLAELELIRLEVLANLPGPQEEAFAKVKEMLHLTDVDAAYWMWCHMPTGGVIEPFHPWLCRAAEAGNAVAARNLGWEFWDNTRQNEQNCVQAVHWFGVAAERGDAYSMFRMGEFYRDGVGVERAPLKAVEFFEKSLEAGSGSAEEPLVAMYYFGDGVEKDTKKAEEILRRWNHSEESVESAWNSIFQDNIEKIWDETLPLDQQPELKRRTVDVPDYVFHLRISMEAEVDADSYLNGSLSYPALQKLARWFALVAPMYEDDDHLFGAPAAVLVEYFGNLKSLTSDPQKIAELDALIEYWTKKE